MLTCCFFYIYNKTGGSFQPDEGGEPCFNHTIWKQTGDVLYEEGGRASFLVDVTGWMQWGTTFKLGVSHLILMCCMRGKTGLPYWWTLPHG